MVVVHLPPIVWGKNYLSSSFYYFFSVLYYWFYIFSSSISSVYLIVQFTSKYRWSKAIQIDVTECSAHCIQMGSRRGYDFGCFSFHSSSTASAHIFVLPAGNYLALFYSICLSINMGSVYQIVQQNKLPSSINLHWIRLLCFYYHSSTGCVSIDLVWHRKHVGRTAPVDYSHPILQHYALYT